MDPKSLDGKPPTFEALNPDFGAKLVAFVTGDMKRAKRAKEEAARKRQAAREGTKAPRSGTE